MLWGKAHPGLGTRGGGGGVCYRQESAGHLPLCSSDGREWGKRLGEEPEPVSVAPLGGAGYC